MNTHKITVGSVSQPGSRTGQIQTRSQFHQERTDALDDIRQQFDAKNTIKLSGLAVVIQYYKQKFAARGQNFQCTVLNNIVDFYSMISRLKTLDQPSKQQFLLLTWDGSHSIAGDIEISLNNVDVFLYDSLSFDDESHLKQYQRQIISTIKDIFKETGKRIDIFLPQLDSQKSKYGCKLFALNGAVQLFKLPDLYDDLVSHSKYDHKQQVWLVEDLPPKLMRYAQSWTSIQSYLHQNPDLAEQPVKSSGETFAQYVERMRIRKDLLPDNELPIGYDEIQAIHEKSRREITWTDELNPMVLWRQIRHPFTYAHHTIWRNEYLNPTLLYRLHRAQQHLQEMLPPEANYEDVEPIIAEQFGLNDLSIGSPIQNVFNVQIRQEPANCVAIVIKNPDDFLFKKHLPLRGAAAFPDTNTQVWHLSNFLSQISQKDARTIEIIGPRRVVQEAVENGLQKLHHSPLQCMREGCGSPLAWTLLLQYIKQELK